MILDKQALSIKNLYQSKYYETKSYRGFNKGREKGTSLFLSFRQTSKQQPNLILTSSKPSDKKSRKCQIQYSQEASFTQTLRSTQIEMSSRKKNKSVTEFVEGSNIKKHKQIKNKALLNHECFYINLLKERKKKILPKKTLSTKPQTKTASQLMTIMPRTASLSYRSIQNQNLLSTIRARTKASVQNKNRNTTNWERFHDLDLLPWVIPTEEQT